MPKAAFISLVLSLVYVMAAPWYGPQGFQCIDPYKSPMAPKVVLYFEETSYHHDKKLAEGNLKMYGVSEDGTFHKVEDARYTVFLNETTGKKRVIATRVDSVNKFTSAMNIGLVGEYHGALPGGPTDELVFTTRSKTSEITLNYESCYTSLGEQNFCSSTGLKVVVGANTEDFHHVTRTLNLGYDSNDAAAIEFVLIGVEYPFPISAVKNYGTNLEKLLSFMDSNKESSKEYFWMRGNALTYDPLRSTLTLHQDSTSSNDIVFEAC